MRFIVCWTREASPASSQRIDLIELVEDFLEPQLVDLVDDDEEHLVVLGTRGAGALQREELVDGEVAAVGDSPIGHADSLLVQGAECSVQSAVLSAGGRVQGAVQGAGCGVRVGCGQLLPGLAFGFPLSFPLSFSLLSFHFSLSKRDGGNRRVWLPPPWTPTWSPSVDPRWQPEITDTLAAEKSGGRKCRS